MKIIEIHTDSDHDGQKPYELATILTMMIGIPMNAYSLGVRARYCGPKFIPQDKIAKAL